MISTLRSNRFHLIGYDARPYFFLNVCVRNVCMLPVSSFMKVLKSYFTFSFLPMVSPASFASSHVAHAPSMPLLVQSTS